MVNLVRRVVSGGKARFVDPSLSLELDLVYLTDRLIIMGYPASGFSALYRNARRDVLRFLRARHGHEAWRIFSMVPRSENEYDPAEFDGRVSRFPFPDRHVPPLSMIPLFVADLTSWLEQPPSADSDGDQEPIAVIHCKAGKGRSGTMAISYLLTLTQMPGPPSNPRNMSGYRTAHHHHQRNGAKQKRLQGKGLLKSTKEKLRDGTQEYEAAEKSKMHPMHSNIGSPDDSLKTSPSVSSAEHHYRQRSQGSFAHVSERLQALFELHTQQRMKRPKHKGSEANLQQSTGQATVSRRPSFASLRSMLRGSSASAEPATRADVALGAVPTGRSTDDLNEYGGDSSFVSSASRSMVSFAESDFSASCCRPGSGTNDGNGDAAPRYGVSIPSQRRWVGYWARILSLTDPRAVLRAHMPKERRQVVITRVTVDRIVQLKKGASNAKSGAEGTLQTLLPQAECLSINVGRYDDGLVTRLESWERAARKRHRAYGAHDPGSSSYDLDLGCADDEDGEHVAVAGEETDLNGVRQRRRKDNKMQRLRNMQQKSSWGINVDAEAEVARTFDWGKDKDETKLNYFARLEETSRKGQVLVRYTFVPDPKLGEIAVPERKSSISSSSSQSPSPQRPPLRAGAGGVMSFSASSRHSSGTNATIPPPSGAYAPRPGVHVKGLPVDADRELNLKILLGRTGATQTLLPESTSAGWAWFIPSFEDPLAVPSAASTTTLRFEKDDIDFCKTAQGVVGMEIEWTWTNAPDLDEQ
ncbi:hypothetical protein K437DRAFT_223724 [Tilletiaria anomala UBC 951]|uniref:phosphatidylinositol-3,4,5-trisphosphate 3-phosphatase n=1 Tax=Tilletiaria anomala (strain ATCC 24038 / CBS 436.72 / UBC 951) TaxID=1037660 RepID=A0A066VX13_TILAU|nr:uncharacterized protein K437DRAFT_223724 [Tilletiaria anomala UBC 951]KDN46267.1 hypothetical protein K437DRAFT_223724 [Tilletiaria anomala UBC 951]